MAGKQRSRASGLLVAVLSGMLALSLGQAMAQTRGTVRGRVLDPTRAPISGARITAHQDGRASALTAVSDGIGEFSLALDPGNYMVEVVAEGFLEASLAVN